MFGNYSISKDKDKMRNKMNNDKNNNDKRILTSSSSSPSQTNVDKQQQGMSRAAKKRRKKLGGTMTDQKKQKVMNDNDNTYDDNDNDDDDDDNDNDNNDDDDNDDNDNDNSTILIKSKRLHGDLSKFDDTVDVDIKTRSILELLELEDVQEIDSYTRSATALSMIIYPNKRSSFYKDFWDQELLINTKSKKVNNKVASSSSSSSSLSLNFFDGLITKEVVLDIIKSHVMYSGIDIKVCKYEGKAVESAYPDYDNDDDGKIDVKYKDVHNKYSMGHTLKLLCPQKYHDPLWHFLSLLESELNTSLSSSVTLIPPGCKCYPARYDFRHNIMLQIEGSSHWMIYQPIDTEEGQFEDHIVDDILLAHMTGKEITLYPGDSLYLPKGWIYREQSCTGAHSLHINIFNNQPNNYGSLLDLLVPEALELLKVKSRKMKQTLPMSFANLMGVAASEDEDPKRGKLINVVKGLLNEVVREAVDMLDAGSDQLFKTFISNRLPIPMSSSEEERSAVGAPNAHIYQYTKLRIVRPGIARAIIEDGKIVVYHCIYNDREHHKTVLSPLEYDLDDGPAIEALLFSYPDGIIVEELPHPSEEVDDKVSIAQSLYKEGLLVIEDETSAPPKKRNDDDDDDDPF